MEQENQPEKIQFIIVPEFILTDSKIPIGEKLLFGDIASHTKQKGYCWGSNEYFEKRYKVSSRTISRWINDFGKTAVLSSIQEYSRWKEEKNAHPKSDYESLRKWLNQKRTNVAYKTNTTAVKETGVDEVSQETLDNLPF